MWSFPDLADVLVGSEHIDQFRIRIVGRIDFVVLRRQGVLRKKQKKRGSRVPRSYPADTDLDAFSQRPTCSPSTV